MVKRLFKWVSELFSIQSPVTSSPGFCYWCHHTDCPFPDYKACQADKQHFKCPYHDKNKSNPPSFCHRCCYGWDPPKTWVKPTIYKPDPVRYDSRLCLDWICEGCDTREKERLELEARKHNNTKEAAELVFTNDGHFFYYQGHEPIEADFELSYDSLAPYVIRILDAANNWHNDGIDFDIIIIRGGRVYIRDDRKEWES